MRIDVKDPKSRFYRAYLNGKWIKYAVMADDEEGVVEVILQDGWGQLVRDDRGRYITEKRFGHVQIVRVESELPGR